MRGRGKKRPICPTTTCTALLLKSGKNLCRQYKLKRAVKMMSTKARVDAVPKFFIPKIIEATACITIKEKIAALCAIGQ